MSNKIIDFQAAKQIQQTKREISKNAPVPRTPLKDTPNDSFEREIITPPKQYSVEDMVDLVGGKETGEIFKTFLKDDDWNGGLETASPPNGAAPLRETLENVWHPTGRILKKNREKKGQLLRMSRAIRAFENECSKRHEEKYGEKVNLKVKLATDEEEVYLADELKKQANFYNKSKLSATMYLIEKKISYCLDLFLDSIKIN